MDGPEQAFENVRDIVRLPGSRMERIGLLILGLLAGYFLPRFTSILLVQCLHLIGANPSARTIPAIVLVTYLICLPVVWFLWRRRRYFAIGILIPVIVQLLIFTSAFAIWWIARMGQSR